MWLDSSPALARQRVWAALRVVNVGLQLSTVHALATIRGCAYSHGSTVDDVARQLTGRDLPVEALTDWLPPPPAGEGCWTYPAGAGLRPATVTGGHWAALKDVAGEALNVGLSA